MSQLTHSTNYFSSEIYRYKNRPDRMIIIYDDDERIAAPAGKLFVERGVENVYVLTGGRISPSMYTHLFTRDDLTGLRKFCEKHEEFVDGMIPDYPESSPPTAKTARSKAGSTSRPPPTGRSGGSMQSISSQGTIASRR